MQTISEWRQAAYEASSPQEAIRCWRELLWLRSDDREAALCLADALFDLGEMSELVQHLQSWLRRNPDDGEALLRLAKVWLELAEWDKAAKTLDRLEDSPEVSDLWQRYQREHKTLPVRFARHLFNDYAPRFDEALAKLGYQAPRYIADVLHPLLLNRSKLSIVDIGCGTGLMAPFLASYAETLTGVDIAEKMLEQAQKRGLYTQLVAADACLYLAGQTAQDLIVAADVLVYIGDLAPLFKAAHAALKPQGLFVFTVETHAPEGEFVLQESRRFAHSATYLMQVAYDTGFHIDGCRDVVLRQDRGMPIEGAVVTLSVRQ